MWPSSAGNRCYILRTYDSWLSADTVRFYSSSSFSLPLQCDLAKFGPMLSLPCALCLTARGIIFRRTRLLGAGVLGGIGIRLQFRKIRDLESLQSALYICTNSRHRAARVCGRLPPEWTLQVWATPSSQ